MNGAKKSGKNRRNRLENRIRDTQHRKMLGAPWCPEYSPKYSQSSSRNSAEQDEDAGELNEAEEVLGLVFVACPDPTERLKPRDGPFYLPLTFVPSEWASILSLAFPVLSTGGDHQGADLTEIGVEAVAVIGFISDQPFRDIEPEGSAERVLYEIDLSGAGTRGMDREWQATRIDHDHDLGAFAFFGGTDIRAPFLAALKVPSMNASWRFRSPWSSSIS